MTETKPVVVLTAMPEEADALLESVEGDVRAVDVAGRHYRHGTLFGVPVVVAVSRCGKVAAASATTDAIIRFSPRAVVFTGVAGGLGEGVNVGDLVVADRLVQHDLDPRPLWPRYTVPLLEKSTFEADHAWADALMRGANACAEQENAVAHRGLVVSGDQFIHDAAHARDIAERLPGALCVEMEGASAAQVACEYGVPFALVRAISDRADQDAPSAFLDSLGRFAAEHSLAVIRSAFSEVAEAAS